jgi:hypothetical protein
MSTFTIDADHNITAYDTPEAAAQSDAALPRFSSQAELAQLAAEWPSSRWIEVWNSIPGHKPVSKLGSSKQAAARVWAALQRLAKANGPAPSSKPKKAVRSAKKAKPARKGAKKASAAQPKKAAATSKRRGEGSSKKAEVIALMRRPKSVSLSDIQKLTGWQKHTVRGFISLLGSKAGLKIISARNEAGGWRNNNTGEALLTQNRKHYQVLAWRAWLFMRSRLEG